MIVATGVGAFALGRRRGPQARAWRDIATRTTDAEVIEALAACSMLEEQSADRPDALLAAHAA